MGYTWSELNLEPCISTRKIMIDGEHEVVVRDYLPIQNKIALIDFVKSYSYQILTGEYNPIFVEIAYSVALVESYTDISFSEEDAENLFEVYDILETNSIIDMVMGAIPKEELKFLQDALDEAVKEKKEE